MANFTQTIGARFEPDIRARIEALAEKATKVSIAQVRATDIIRECVIRHLPVLEAEYGVGGSLMLNDAPPKAPGGRHD